MGRRSKGLLPHRGGVTTALLAAGLVVAHRALCRWEQRWEATVEECTKPLPGDDVVAEPVSQVTRAITIDATVSDLWPWVVQLGADRGGFYSYDWLENLFGLGIHNADRVVPEWQTRSVGDLVFADHSGSGGWYIVELRPEDTLAMAAANVSAGRPLRRDEGLRWEFLWTFALRPLPDGRCRLLVRERVAFASRRTRWLMAPLGPVSFVMTRKTLLGLKLRAEASARCAAIPRQRDRRRAAVPLGTRRAVVS